MQEAQGAKLPGHEISSARPDGSSDIHNRAREDRPSPRRSPALRDRWGNLLFVVSSLVMRDFKVRYRNMSLGVLWSLANPLIMMMVLTFVFIRVFPNTSVKSFPVFFLTGLVPFNFFSAAWSAGTVSIYANAGFVKRVRMQRELIPLSAVLAQALHFFIQIGLLLILAFLMDLPVTRLWLWILPIALIELMSVSGIALLCSTFDVYLRDTRYIVDSAATVLFWLTPIFYPADLIPAHYRLLYELNPVASTVICLRNILLDLKRPAASMLLTSLVVSLVLLGLGASVFGRFKDRFGDYL
jgi:ABC-type polysaccharide/polyol phosphate export permease